MPTYRAQHRALGLDPSDPLDVGQPAQDHLAALRPTNAVAPGTAPRAGTTSSNAFGPTDSFGPTDTFGPKDSFGPRDSFSPTDPSGLPGASGLSGPGFTQDARPNRGPDGGDGDLLYRVLGGLALRDLSLVESLLQVVEKLESNEEDAEQLELLFRIDHLATRMRRNSENLLVLAGHDQQGRDLEPVPLLDVARAAISEITDYSRAQISSLPDVEVLGVAADDLSHILAELLENATSKSPESAAVVIRAERTGDGTMVISVEDSGIGIPSDQLAEINTRLGRPPVVDAGVTRHMGLYVVGRLAQRHGIRVQLRERPYGGITANVITPGRLVRADPTAPPRTARRPSTRPQPVVAPGGPRLTAVGSPGPATAPPSGPAGSPRPGSAVPPGSASSSQPGPAVRPGRPVPPPASAPDVPGGSGTPGSPAAPPAPRFAPADPSLLPRRTPGRRFPASALPQPANPPGARPPGARPPDDRPPVHRPPADGPAADRPAAGKPGTEPPPSRADRIRDELADFRLGQRDARAAAPGPAGTGPAGTPAPASTPAPATPPVSRNGLPELHHSDDMRPRDGEEGDGPGPAEGTAGGQAGTEAGPT